MAMTPEVLLDLARIQRRVMGLPEPLVRLHQLEQLLCGFLTKEERRQYAAEYVALTTFPFERQAAA
jgi:hypothetical protein